MALGKYQMFGLVRDKATGKPKVDNPGDLHPIQVGMMTKQEREDFDIWPGSFARDAQGIKRVTVQNGEVFAEDDLIAVNELFVLPDDGTGAKVIAVKPRQDVQSGKALVGVAVD